MTELVQESVLARTILEIGFLYSTTSIMSKHGSRRPDLHKNFMAYLTFLPENMPTVVVLSAEMR